MASRNAIAWSPDGTRIASSSGGEDTTLQVWDAFTGNNFFTYTDHTAHISILAWSPDGTLIASGSTDRTIHVWP